MVIIKIDTNKGYKSDVIRDSDGLITQEIFNQVEGGKCSAINDEFLWKPEYFKKAKKVPKNIYGKHKLMFEGDILNLKEGEEHRISSPGWTVLNKYIRKGKWCYCMEIDSGKIDRLVKNDVYYTDSDCEGDEQ